MLFGVSTRRLATEDFFGVKWGTERRFISSGRCSGLSYCRREGNLLKVWRTASRVLFHQVAGKNKLRHHCHCQTWLGQNVEVVAMNWKGNKPSPWQQSGQLRETPAGIKFSRASCCCLRFASHCLCLLRVNCCDINYMIIFVSQLS